MQTLKAVVNSKRPSFYLTHMKLDTAYLLWVTPLICTPAEVIGLAQDIAQIAVDELQILCEKYDTEPTEFDWVRDYVRNPDRRDYRQMLCNTNELELVFADHDPHFDIGELTSALNSFAKIVSELQGDDPFEYEGVDCFCEAEDCDCEHEEFKSFADKLRAHTYTIGSHDRQRRLLQRTHADRRN